MNNATTTETTPPANVLRRLLLGESLKNSLIRLTVILSAIILVWAAMILILTIRLRCQRARQISKTATSHRLYDNDDNLVSKRSDPPRHNRRFDSSTSSLNSSNCYFLRVLCARLSRQCRCCPSPAIVSTFVDKGSSIASNQPSSIPLSSSMPLAKIQIVVDNASQRSSSLTPNLAYIKTKLSLYPETSSSSAEELKRLCSADDEHELPTEAKCKPVSNTQLAEPKQFLHQTSLPLPISDSFAPSPERLRMLHEFNTKATKLFHPITRRLSNVNTNSCLPPMNAIHMQQQRKSLLVVSSARELTTDNRWNWKHSLVDTPAARDERITLSARQLPLVMITDTSSSNTNIVELETYEDNHRLMTDVEKRLARQLRSSYRPRHST